jgi:hypothetical protein
MPPDTFKLLDISLKANLSLWINTNIFYTLRNKSKIASNVIETVINKKFDLSIWPDQFESLKAENFDFLKLSNFSRVFISSHSPFYGSEKLFDVFRVRKNLKEQIDEITNRFGSHTIGVHIRRTDHKKAIIHSPLKLFIEAMKKEIIENGETDFFLATDCPNTECTIRDLFKGRIMIHQKEFSRRTVSGVESAVVDLFCLSNTKKILGSYRSSFSHTAAEINGVELKTIKFNCTHPRELLPSKNSRDWKRV